MDAVNGLCMYFLVLLIQKVNILCLIDCVYNGITFTYYSDWMLVRLLCL